MTLRAPSLQPGVFGDETRYMAETTYWDGDRVRFRSGFPETIGGWGKHIEGRLDGRGCAIWTWAENDGTVITAVGTAKKLLLIRNGVVYNITPIEASGSLSGAFATQVGVKSVTVSHAAHGRAVGDTVVFSGAADVGGLDVNGSWVVSSVPDADTFVFDHDDFAGSTGTAGGGASIAYEYELAIGAESGANIRQWCLRNWGEDLLATPGQDGKIYYWDASGGVDGRATVLAGAPTARWLIVSPGDRHALVLGADGDPLKIQWCDQEDLSEWSPTATTTAGDIRLFHGSRIVTGTLGQNEVLIWTDVGLVHGQYVGGRYIWAFEQVGLHCGPVGPNAVISVDGVAYWMGRNNFYRYTGVVEVLPCTLQRAIFNGLDRAEAGKVVAGVNTNFSEVWWFYPSASGDGENDRYVIFGTKEGTWTPGTMDRVAWHESELLSYPLGLAADGYLYDHERGITADGAPMEAFISTGAFDLSGDDAGDGEFFMFLSRVILDAVMEGNMDVTITAWRSPNSPPIVKGPYRVTSGTAQIFPRIRGRHLAYRIATPASDFEELVTDAGEFMTDEAGDPITAEGVFRNRGDDLATFWRIGKLRFDIQADGRQ